MEEQTRNKNKHTHRIKLTNNLAIKMKEEDYINIIITTKQKYQSENPELNQREACL